jgi:hypothetical protein
MGTTLMALKHYGGSTPAPAATWICPTCKEENTQPLKAGCQFCGAGGDARKAGTRTSEDMLSSPARRDRGNPAASLVPDTPEYAAYVTWRATAGDIGPEEAFMAGVAWAQAQQTSTVIPSTRPSAPPETLVTMDIAFSDEITSTTILAALAFYAQNVLSYGAVPGQLSADQVESLIARLTPSVTEPE